MKYVEFIDKYGGNNKITKKDLKDFAALGGSQEDAQDFLKKASEGKKGYKGTVGEGAFDFVQKDKKFPGTLPTANNNTPTTTNAQDFADQYVGSEEILYGFLDADREDRQLHETFINNLNKDALYNIGLLERSGGIAVAGIQAGAETYGYDTQYDIARLQDARERDLVKYTTQVEDTRLRDFKDKDIAYGLNLQNIINSGLVAVAETQGMYSVSGIATRGRYDTEVEKIRANANTDIAQMNMYANMMMAMGF